MSREVIDLCSDTEEQEESPSVLFRAPMHKKGHDDDDDEVIVLLSDSDEEGSIPIPEVTSSSFPPTRTRQGTLLDYFALKPSSSKSTTRRTASAPTQTSCQRQRQRRQGVNEALRHSVTKSTLTSQITSSSSMNDETIEVETKQPTIVVKKEMETTLVSSWTMDPDVVIVEESSTMTSLERDDLQTNNKDDECMIVGHKGNNALSDFPHSRADCVIHPMVAAAVVVQDMEQLYCSNCFCFVCDILVTECQHWSLHCRAHYKNLFWTMERHRKRNMKDSYIPRSMDPIITQNE